MSGYIEKVRGIFRSPALRAIGEWIRPVRGNVIAITMIGMINSLMGLAVTMVTRMMTGTPIRS